MSSIKLILGTMTFSDQADSKASQAMIESFSSAGYNELDTAHVYNNGQTEQLLGELISPAQRQTLYIAGKVNPWNDNGLQPEEIKRQLYDSLKRLNTDFVDLLYLHAPDLNTPIKQTLEACNALYEKGKFKHFGLSNYAAWQVAEIVQICTERGWLRPTVYQGMYNALTRDVEKELFACLRHYEMNFYAYNPLAGGLLTAKHGNVEQLPAQGRFASFDGYQDRYWKNEYFNAINQFQSVCTQEGISTVDAALRWLQHHSHLSVSHGDGIIVGASKPAHLTENLNSAHQGVLPKSIVDVLDQGWDIVKSDCISYFRT